MAYQGYGQQPFLGWLSEHQQPHEIQAQAQPMAAWSTTSPSSEHQLPHLAQYSGLSDPFAPEYPRKGSHQTNMWAAKGQTPSSHVAMQHPPYSSMSPQHAMPLPQGHNTAAHDSRSNAAILLDLQQPQGMQLHASPVRNTLQAPGTYQHQITVHSSAGATQSTPHSTPKMGMSGLLTPPGHPVYGMSHVTPPTPSYQRTSSAHTHRMLMTPESGTKARAPVSHISLGSSASSPIVIPCSNATELRTPIGRSQGTSASASIAAMQPVPPHYQQQAKTQTEVRRQEQHRAETLLECRKSHQTQHQAAASMTHYTEDQIKAVIESRRRHAEHTRKRKVENQRRAQLQAIEGRRQEQVFQDQRQRQILAEAEKRRLALEHQAVEKERQRLEKQRQSLFERQVEQELKSKEQRLKRERKYLRKEQLRKDPSALYRHYNEYVEYFPLGEGEYKSQYLNSLLANRPMPAESKSDLGLAIQYAKDNWELFLVSTKTQREEAADWQRKKLADITTDKEKDTTK
jgi:flagellar biosynthesis GTPase FlhF